MKYVFDFDRVLFDTDGFIERLEKEGLGSLPRNMELLKAIEVKEINWETFVNPGVTDFLHEYGPVSAIVSSYVSRNRLDNSEPDSELSFFQSEKIKRSGLSMLVNQTTVTGAEKNTELKSLYTEGATLVDDEVDHLKGADEIGFRTVWFRTSKNRACDVGNSAGFFPKSQVSSFNEFVTLDKEWNQKQ